MPGLAEGREKEERGGVCLLAKKGGREERKFRDLCLKGT